MASGDRRNRRAELVLQFAMAGEFGAVVESNGLAGADGKAAEARLHGLAGFQRGFAFQTSSERETSHAFTQGQQVAPLGAELHQVSFPMAEFLARSHGFRALRDRSAIGDRFPAPLEVAPSPAGLGPGQVTIQPIRAHFGPVDEAVDCLGAHCVLILRA